MRVPRNPASWAAWTAANAPGTRVVSRPYMPGGLGTTWRGRGEYTANTGGNHYSLFGNAFSGNSLSLPSLSSFFGAGDYRQGDIAMSDGVVDNSITGAGLSSEGIPQFASHSSSYTVSKSELVQKLFAPPSGSQEIQYRYSLNPGLLELFPWLSLVSAQFEEYEFKQLMFYYRPMVSDFFSSSGQTGTVAMVTQYNVHDPPFSDLQTALNYDMAAAGKTTAMQRHGVECNPALNSGPAGKFIRLGPIENTGYGGSQPDLQLYDLGNTSVIINGTDATLAGQMIGFLYVSYTVELRKPKLPNKRGETIARDYFSSKSFYTTPIHPIPATDIVYGQQNRINDVGQGLTISQTIGGTLTRFTYTIPAWFTGQLMVSINVCALQPTPGAAATIVPAGWGWDVSGLSSSNITPIYDMFDADYNSGTGQANNIRKTATSINKCYVNPNGNNTWIQTFEYHCNVGLPTVSGSTLIIDGIAGSSNPLVYFWTVDCREYNTTFNSASGPPLLLDANGASVTSPFN